MVMGCRTEQRQFTSSRSRIATVCFWWQQNAVNQFISLFINAYSRQLSISNQHGQPSPWSFSTIILTITGGFLKWWYPQIIPFNRTSHYKFHHKPSILGYHHLWENRISTRNDQAHLITINHQPINDHQRFFFAFPGSFFRCIEPCARESCYYRCLEVQRCPGGPTADPLLHVAKII